MIVINKETSELITGCIAACEKQLAEILGCTVSINVTAPSYAFNERAFLAAQVKKTVATEFGLTIGELESVCRKKPAPEARFMCFQILSERGFSLSEIAKEFPSIGNHTSVLHGKNKCKSLMQTEQVYDIHYKRVVANLNSI